MNDIDWSLYSRSMADFAIASLLHAENTEALNAAAGRVLAYHDGGLMTVSDLTTRAASHGWNSMIYEAWSWEFGNQIRALSRSLPVIQREALMLYAGATGDLDTSRSEAYGAIYDAQRALYGDADDMEGDSEIEFNDE